MSTQQRIVFLIHEIDYIDEMMLQHLDKDIGEIILWYQMMTQVK